MSHRVLQSHVRRRYRAGARLALLVTLLVGTAVSGVFGAPPSVEISHQATPPAPALQPVPAPAPALPSPEIEPASLPVPVILSGESAFGDALIIVGPAVVASPSPTPSVERLVL